MNPVTELRALREVADVNPPLISHLADDDLVSFVPMSAVSAEMASVFAVEERRYAQVQKGYTPFRRGDVLLAKITPCFENGKIAQANLPRDVGFGSTEFHVIRPKSGKLDARFLLHFLRQGRVRRDGESRMTGSAGQRRVPEHFIAELLVPVLPLAEQQRIAEVLDRAEALRAKRRASLAQLDTLIQSIFLDLFDDPVTNPRRWPSEALTAVCHCYSGGTPSKSDPLNWKGPVPWFSAKDLKANDLFDSQDHVNEDVLRASTLKLLPKNTVAIVVRGMILAHTFPVCVLRIPAIINQDLKALLPREPVEPQFLAACLRCASAHALQQVSEAGHGTKRLDAGALSKIPVVLPPIALQHDFACRVAAIERLKSAHRASLVQLDALFASLQHRAFRGELWPS